MIDFFEIFLKTGSRNSFRPSVCLSRDSVHMKCDIDVQLGMIKAHWKGKRLRVLFYIDQGEGAEIEVEMVEISGENVSLTVYGFLTSKLLLIK